MVSSTSVAAVGRANSPSQVSQTSLPQEIIGKASDAIRCDDIPGAVRVLSAGFGDNLHGAVLSLLDSSVCAPQGALSSIRQAIIEETFKQHPNFDLNAHNKEGKTVLDLAVKHDDREFARYLLRNGADPQRTSLALASWQMGELVTQWRRTNLLYARFDGQNSPSLTPIDRALREGRHEEVKARLESMLQANGMNKVWHEAMESGMHDILRALLVVSGPHELRELIEQKHLVGEWIHKLRADPGLVNVLKEFPYQSAKRGRPEELNREVRFTSGEEILCRHLATYQILQRQKDRRFKIDYGKLKSKKDIAGNVGLDTEKKYYALRAQASELHLIDNRTFGRFVAKQFEAMEKEGKQSRQMSVNSTNHAMSMALRIKEEGGKKSYVVQFYDPNETMTDTRSKTDCSKTFETQTLGDYIANSIRLTNYYPAPKGDAESYCGKSMIFVVPEGKVQTSGANSLASGTGRRLSAPLDPGEVDSTTIWYLMENGLAEDLRMLGDHFNKLSQDEQVNLLSGHYGGEVTAPPLYMASWMGHADAVRAYGELLASIQPHPPIEEDQLIDLLAGKANEGELAICVGMSEGHVDAIKAIGEMILSQPSLSADKKADLLLAKITDGPSQGWSGLSDALEMRQFGTAKVQLEFLNLLVPTLSEDKRREVLDELKGQDMLTSSSTALCLNRSARKEWAEMHAVLTELKAALEG